MPSTLSRPDLVAALPRLRRYAWILTSDLDLADELVEDTLAHAWKERGLRRAGSDLRAWLFTIMHRVHATHHATRGRGLADNPPDADDGPIVDRATPVRATQSDRAEQAEVLQRIDRLPVEQREVLILAAIERLGYEEIARVQGAPIGTVMSRLNRAREELRRRTDDALAPVTAIKSNSGCR